MNNTSNFRRLSAIAIAAICLVVFNSSGCIRTDAGQSSSKRQTNSSDNSNGAPNLTSPNRRTSNRVRVLVMDPLSRHLGCACVPNHGQRDYRAVGSHLAKCIGVDVELFYGESVIEATERLDSQFDLIIGPRGVVLADAKRANLIVNSLAGLTNKLGEAHVSGQLVVRTDSQINSAKQLAGKTILLGPLEIPECHLKATEYLKEMGLVDGTTIRTAETVDAAVYEVADGNADATFIPDYLLPILEGCGKIEKDSFRRLAITNSVPFIEVFHVARPSAHQASDELFETEQVKSALRSFGESLEKMETLEGFVTKTNWRDWRGENRSGVAQHLPGTNGDELTPIWTANVTGPAMAGLSATDQFVFVADKSKDLSEDIFRCFDAESGRQIWTLEHPSAKNLDYTNAPRATPLIVGEHVYFLGVMGNLHAVEIATGRETWKRETATEFNAEIPVWGYSSTPLLVGPNLVINPGAPDAAIVAINRFTGKTAWATPGHAAAYSSFLLASVNGNQQIIGFDSAGLAGWNSETGKTPLGGHTIRQIRF